MGPNISRAVSDLSQKIDNEMSTISSSSANIQCGIQVGDITLRKAKRCNVRNQNRCGASASASIDATAKAAAEAFQKTSVEMKTKLLPGININDTRENIETIIKNKISQKCQTDAAAALSISSGNIVIDECEDSEVININTGDATSNCGVRAVLDTVNKAGNEVKVDQKSGGLGDFLSGDNMLLNGTVSIVSLVCCFLVCIISIIVIIIATMAGK